MGRSLPKFDKVATLDFRVSDSQAKLFRSLIFYRIRYGRLEQFKSKTFAQLCEAYCRRSSYHSKSMKGKFSQ